VSSRKPSSDAAGAVPAKVVREFEKTKPMDLGVVERRRTIRPLPVPDAVESNGDTDWATFQALNTEQPDKT
jgi:hypothetical protein